MNLYSVIYRSFDAEEYRQSFDKVVKSRIKIENVYAFSKDHAELLFYTNDIRRNEVCIKVLDVINSSDFCTDDIKRYTGTFTFKNKYKSETEKHCFNIAALSEEHAKLLFFRSVIEDLTEMVILNVEEANDGKRVYVDNMTIVTE